MHAGESKARGRAVPRAPQAAPRRSLNLPTSLALPGAPVANDLTFGSSGHTIDEIA